MADEDDKPCPGEDMMHVGPDIGGGMHPCVRHMPDHSLRVGFFQEHRPKDDEAVNKPLVHLTHKGPGSVYKVEELTPGAVSAGPSRVATRAYRDGWDRIFGTPKTVGQA